MGAKRKSTVVEDVDVDEDVDEDANASSNEKFAHEPAHEPAAKRVRVDTALVPPEAQTPAPAQADEGGAVVCLVYVRHGFSVRKWYVRKSAVPAHILQELMGAEKTLMEFSTERKQIDIRWMITQMAIIAGDPKTSLADLPKHLPYVRDFHAIVSQFAAGAVSAEEVAKLPPTKVIVIQ